MIFPLNYIAYAGLRLWAPLFLSADVKSISPCDSISAIPPDVPVTIFASLDDTEARIDEATALHEKVQSHAKLVVVTGGRHGELFETHRRQYERALFDLLSRIDAEPQ